MPKYILGGAIGAVILADIGIILNINNNSVTPEIFK